MSLQAGRLWLLVFPISKGIGGVTPVKGDA